MKSGNKKWIVVIFIFFIFALFAYREYDEWKGEKYIPNRYKNENVYESPTYTPNGLFLIGDSIWISSGHDHSLIEYDLTAQTVVQSLDVPCFEASGLAFDGENFWIADYGKRMLYKISPEGKVLGAYRTPYSTPYGVTWDGENLWVLDVFGLEEYPNLYRGVYPDAIIYKYDPETNRILDTIDSPAPFAGDIAYKDDELLITGCTSRKIFHVNVHSKETTSWYYSPDTFPRAIAIGEGNDHLVTGMTTRDIWEVNLDKQAQYKDIRREHDVIIPFWLIIIILLLLLPIFLDELMTKKYKPDESIVEKAHSFLLSHSLSSFLFKAGVIAVFIYYVSNYQFLREVTGLVTKAFLGVFGVSTILIDMGSFIFLEGFAMTKACLSLIFIAITVGVIFATTITLRKKILLSFLGFCIIFSWNILRLSIFVVLVQNGLPFVLAHDFFFIVGGFFITAAIFWICSILSPEIKKDFSFISEIIKENFISKYSDIT
jgi:exosortase/archaeosortase family protein